MGYHLGGSEGWKDLDDRRGKNRPSLLVSFFFGGSRVLEKQLEFHTALSSYLLYLIIYLFFIIFVSIPSVLIFAKTAALGLKDTDVDRV